MALPVQGQETQPADNPAAADVETPTVEPTATQPAATELEASEQGGEKPWFGLRRFDGFVEFESQYDQSRVKYDNPRFLGRDREIQNRDWSLQEKLGFDLAGYLVDPTFMNFAGNFVFGLSQDHYDEQDSLLGQQSDSDWGHLLEYDFRINIFEGKKFSGSVYGLRQDDRINRRFQPTLDQTRTGFGTSWTWADETLPMELSYDYLETDRTGNRDREDDEKFQDSNLHYGATWNITDYHRFKLAYDHSSNKQEYQGIRDWFETQRDLFTLEHQVEFGGNHRHELRTLVHWQEESGDLARDLFEIGPQLTLKHSDQFQTMYKYQYLSEEYERLQIDQQRLDWQFVHQLYSNLTTTGNVFGLYEKIADDAETYQYGASVDWQYNRNNPYGQFLSNLALGFDQEHLQGDDGLRAVLNESATFHDPLTVVLRQRNVLRHTIFVTDATNRRLYARNVDFFIIRQGEWTRLVRIPTGRIADGETVLIDYKYRIPTNGRVDSQRVDVGVEQRFNNGITPYYRFAYRNQDVDYSDGFPVEADRTDHHHLGVKYDQERYYLGAELEIFDDTIEPYNAIHFDGRYDLLQGSEHSLQTAARLSRFFFEGGLDKRNVTQIDLELSHRWLINDKLSTNNRAVYRWQDDTVAGLTNGVDLSTGLEYLWGDMTVELSADYDLLDLPDSREDGFGVWLKLRRDFPNLFGIGE